MSPLSHYQSTISRNAIGRTLHHATRPGTLTPDHSPRPNFYPPQVWRPPRSRPGTRQIYVPPLVYETQQQLPWRAERQRRQESSIIGRETRRDEVRRITNPPHPSAASAEQPARGHRRYTRVPRERTRFPERRPNHTRHVSPSAQEDQRSGHRGLKQEEYWNNSMFFSESSRDYDRTRDRRHHNPQREGYTTSYYIPPTPLRDYGLSKPPHAESKRWSMSSDSSSSSTNSIFSWPSSTTICPSTPTIPTRGIQPNPYNNDIRRRYPENHSNWSRSHDGWIVDDDFVPSGDLSAVDNDDYVRSPSTDHYSSEDFGQTTVYADCDIVRRNPRVADRKRRPRNFDGLSIVQLPCELDGSRSSHFGRSERPGRVENGKTRRRRPYVLPIWSELPPRNMNNIRRAEGIRYRFPRDLEDAREPEDVYFQSSHGIGRNFPSRRHRPQRRRQETHCT